MCSAKCLLIRVYKLRVSLGIDYPDDTAILWHRDRLPFLNRWILVTPLVFTSWKVPALIGTQKIRLGFMTLEFFGRWGECRFYTACCLHKMAGNVARSAANRVGRLIMPGRRWYKLCKYIFYTYTAVTLDCLALTTRSLFIALTYWTDSRVAPHRHISN